MKVEYSVSKNYVAALCLMSQANGCKDRQVFQTYTRMFVEDWFLLVGTDWKALSKPLYGLETYSFGVSVLIPYLHARCSAFILSSFLIL